MAGITTTGKKDSRVGGNNVTVNGVELDHNNFTDSTYTKRQTDCGYEAGGMKFIANDVTVKNSSIHDNACEVCGRT